LVIRQIRSLLYEQGFTIGGARQRLAGDEARTDSTQSQQIIRQVRAELEDVLKLLRRRARAIAAARGARAAAQRRATRRVRPAARLPVNFGLRSGRGAAW